MKKIKYFLSAFLLLSMAWSCANDDFGTIDFVGTAVAPTNVSALYNITQDNTGLVTITPNGEGAVSYDIYYGDDTVTAINVVQGQSTAHVYGEGIYSVKIVAIGISGLKTEVTQNLVVSFKAPENLVVSITNDLAISKQVNVTATADYATMFDVYFGEEGNDVPVSANIGEPASYTYKEAGTYTIRVVAKSAAIQTTEQSESFDVTAILQPTTAAPAPTSRQAINVISIFSGAYTNVAGSNYNPDWGQSGQGSSYALFDLNGDKMLNYIKLSYQGISIGQTIDVSNMEYLHMDVWTADGSKIETSLINGVDGNSTEKPVVSDLTKGEWTSINIPISDYTSQGLSVDQIFQLKFVGTPWAAGTVFIDNLYFYKKAAESIQMPIDFESTTLTYAWVGFGGNTATLVANPDKSGSNLSNNVVKFDKESGAQVWAGASLKLDSSVNFAKGTKVSVNVWSPKVGAKILFKMEDSNSPKDGNGNASVVVEVEALTTVANGWQVLTFDLTGFPAFSAANSYDTIVIFPDFGATGTGSTYYFDDIKQF